MSDLELPGMEGIASRREQTRRDRVNAAEDRLNAVLDLFVKYHGIHARLSTRRLQRLRSAIDQVLEARS